MHLVNGAYSKYCIIINKFNKKSRNQIEEKHKRYIYNRYKHKMSNLDRSKPTTSVILESKKWQAIISVDNLQKFVTTVTPNTSGLDLYYIITSRYGLSPKAFYITDRLKNKRVVCSADYMPFAYLDECDVTTSCDDTNNRNDVVEQYLDVNMRLPGGGIMSRIFKSVFKAIFSVFQPIVKPLQAIADAFLLLIKAVVFIISLTVWLFKLMVWFFVQFLPSIPLDIILLIKQLTTLLITTIIQTISQILKRIVNFVGRQTIYGISGGWDNARDSTQTSENDTDVDPKSCTQHCYRAADGSVPFSLVVVTVLCPPAGVFMEFGMHGWLKILVCLVLTLLLYFPGLIYALILLYC